MQETSSRTIKCGSKTQVSMTIRFSWSKMLQTLSSSYIMSTTLQGFFIKVRHQTLHQTHKRDHASSTSFQMCPSAMIFMVMSFLPCYHRSAIMPLCIWMPNLNYTLGPSPRPHDHIIMPSNYVKCK